MTAKKNDCKEKGMKQKRLWGSVLLALSIGLSLALLHSSSGLRPVSALEIAQASSPPSRAITPERPGYFDFGGRYLVSISDADMLASAYIDNQLGERQADSTDTLSVIPLGVPAEQLAAVKLPVSNSVGAWPNCLALTPDGKTAFVTETFAPAPAGAKLRSDLPAGRLLSVIDLANPRQPRVISRQELGNRPMAISVHPQGDWLAVSLSEPNRQIALIPWRNGQLGEPTFHALPGIDDADAHTPHLEWHPSGRFLGVTFPNRNQAMFYEVERSRANQPTLRQWGNPITTGKFPGVGHFTPDGRHFVTTDLLWGQEFEGKTDLDPSSYEALRGHLTVIRFAQVANLSGEVLHQVVSTAPVGGSAEEFAISPNGRFVVALNMEASFMPWNDERLTWYSSLTLLTLNSTTGRLTPVGTFPFEGILPEGISFDTTSNYLAVAIFDHFNPARRGGSIDFWRLTQTDIPMLVKTDLSLPVVRGAHVVKLVP